MVTLIKSIIFGLFVLFTGIGITNTTGLPGETVAGLLTITLSILVCVIGSD